MSQVDCDRCGEPGAEVFRDCPTCGPVPLCEGCVATHRMEMADEALYELNLIQQGDELPLRCGCGRALPCRHCPKEEAA